jgi:hypothetical protein
MSLIRGVLLAGKFRTHHELNGMSHEDQRNTLIVELSNRSNQKNFQAFNDAALADAGAALVFLRTARIRDDTQLKTISIDDMRNILIVEIGAMTGMGQELQGLSNIDLVALGLGKLDPSIWLHKNTFLRGVLLAGKFRTQHELNSMSEEDQRNTLIVELSGRSNQHNFQSFNTFELAGMGAVLVFLREARIRDDAQLKTISIDDMRNILIVEIDGQTHLGSRLQSLSNIDLVRLGLGVDPVVVFKPPPPDKCVVLKNRVVTLEERIAELKADMEGATGSVLHGLAGKLTLARNQLTQARARRAAECKRVIVHFKSLLPINNDAINLFINTQFIAMQRLFAKGGLAILRGTTEDLSGNPALQLLQNLDVGQCRGTPTAEQTTLFANRNNVGNNELVVYIVANLIDASGTAGNFLGCATHPTGQPGAAVVQNPAGWLVAHEVGHVLRLRHVCEVVSPGTPPPPVPCAAGHSDSLMFPNVGWTNVPPDLAASEYTTMINSSLNIF